MRNLKGKSEDAAGSDAIESFKDEHLDTKAVDTRQKRSREVTDLIEPVSLR